MKENDIRPADLNKKSEEIFEIEAREFLSFSDNFVEVSCPACECNNKKINFVKKGYVFKKCEDCGALYISPRPLPELLKKYYSTSKVTEFWQDYVFPQSKESRIKNIYKPRADLILDVVKRYNTATDLLIDIGAGTSFFGAEIAARNVFKKIILIDPGQIKLENSRTIEVINDSFENVNIDLNPDIITGFELIEHLFSPVDFLNKVYRWMKKNSYFICTTPNIEGFELLTLFDKSPNITGPTHLNYFNTASISLLFKKVGFKNIEISTPGELDADVVINKYNEGLIDLKDQPFLYYLLIEKGDVFSHQFQDFLKNNKLSSNMLVIANKS